MKYVLDACVALRWVLIEQDSDKARRLRDNYQNQIHELIAPESFSVECAHSLTKKERQRIIPDARKLWDDIMLDSPGYTSILPLMDRALEISIQTRQGVYDCLYVALAEREGCELLTADDRLIRNFQPTYPFITPLTSLL